VPTLTDTSHTTSPQPRARSDGEASRQRLLLAALRLFAGQGFARTSIREIAAAAHVNVGAISYYFGDKQGLYRAAFTEPLGSARDDIPLFSNPALSLREALLGLFTGFVAPLKQCEDVRLCTRLHMREMVEPTGLWAEEINTGIRPYQQALVDLLRRHLGLPAEDDALHRLAFSIVAQGVFLCIGRDVIEAVRPTLLDSPQAIDAWAAQMVACAVAMVAVERERRQSLHSTPPVQE
jgi:TetR/AcrR family transcriptional regulator, regulator of cefoperazone and chloramphenicol sensitivity